ncbi:hypothetical protein KR018_002849 [Drosophila ironensis]|nr:hypothetical protein KR018_002849 [Drosophila ironensis]
MEIFKWFISIPRITRYWMTITVVLSTLVRSGVIHPHRVYLDRDLVLGKLQLWRCLTSLFVFPVAPTFHFVVNCYFLVQFSSKLEKEPYRRFPADYLYMLMIAGVLANMGGLCFKIRFLMDVMVMTVTNVWCQLNKNVVVSFWFGSPFRALYLPWVILGFELVFRLSAASLIGIFSGYFYYFFMFTMSQDLGGPALLMTPRFLKRLVPDISTGFGGFGQPPVGRAAMQQAAQVRWRRGTTLSNN